MDAKETRSYRTSDDGLVIYDAEDPSAYVSSSVCVELEESA
jgi:hypothetical protein